MPRECKTQISTSSAWRVVEKSLAVLKMERSELPDTSKPDQINSFTPETNRDDHGIECLELYG
jgi:hypothetical protein